MPLPLNGFQDQISTEKAEFQGDPLRGNDEMVGDVATDLDQGPGQPLVHDEVEEEEYHDAQEEVE